MEILKDTVPTVTFYYPAPSTVPSSATWTKNGSAQTPNLVITPSSDGTYAQATLPYQPDEAAIEVTWNFSVGNSGSFSKTDKYSVVTPYLTLREIKNIIQSTDDDEAADVEAAVRSIINAHTGQSFGKFTGDITVTSRGDKALMLPMRSVRLDSFSSEFGTTPLYDTSNFPGGGTMFLGQDRYAVSGDGWYIKALGYNDTSIKKDVAEITSTNGVIYYPYGYTTGWGYLQDYIFPKDCKYILTGVWGWDDVPAAVVEATKLLVNDYSSMDAMYRDKYLSSLTSPDWRIQYYSGAFVRTGNVRADQLLSDYVLQRGWTVI